MNLCGENVWSGWCLNSAVIPTLLVGLCSEAGLRRAGSPPAQCPSQSRAGPACLALISWGFQYPQGQRLPLTTICLHSLLQYFITLAVKKMGVLFWSSLFPESQGSAGFQVLGFEEETATCLALYFLANICLQHTWCRSSAMAARVSTDTWTEQYWTNRLMWHISFPKTQVLLTNLTWRTDNNQIKRNSTWREANWLPRCTVQKKCFNTASWGFGGAFSSVFLGKQWLCKRVSNWGEIYGSVQTNGLSSALCMLGTCVHLYICTFVHLLWPFWNTWNILALLLNKALQGTLGASHGTWMLKAAWSPNLVRAIHGIHLTCSPRGVADDGFSAEENVPNWLIPLLFLTV